MNSSSLLLIFFISVSFSDDFDSYWAALLLSSLAFWMLCLMVALSDSFKVEPVLLLVDPALGDRFGTCERGMGKGLAFAGLLCTLFEWLYEVGCEFDVVLFELFDE